MLLEANLTMHGRHHAACMQRSWHAWQMLFSEYPQLGAKGPKSHPLTCPDEEVFSGRCQEAEVLKESGPSPPSWLSESEEEAGTGASGLLGSFYVFFCV